MAIVLPNTGIILPKTFHGAVFQYAKASPVARANVVPIRPLPPTVTLSQQQFANSASMWGTLTPAEKAMWGSPGPPAIAPYTAFMNQTNLSAQWGMYLYPVPLSPSYFFGLSWLFQCVLGPSGENWLQAMPLTPATPTPDLYIALYFAPNQATRITGTGNDSNTGFKDYPAVPTAKYVYIGLFGPCPWLTYTTLDIDSIVTELCGFRPQPAIRDDPAETYTASYCVFRYYPLIGTGAAEYALDPVAYNSPPYDDSVIFGGNPYA
jgi:hypothetical protein